MVISKKDYERLKEYYDFQRKKQYNREQLMYVCGHIMGIDQDDASDNDFFDNTIDFLHMDLIQIL